MKVPVKVLSMIKKGKMVELSIIYILVNIIEGKLFALGAPFCAAQSGSQVKQLQLLKFKKCLRTAYEPLL